MTSRVFTHEQASALLPEVRRITDEHQRLLLELRERQHERTGAQGAAAQRRTHKLNDWINHIITQWSEAITALGALPKGLWTVDFDSGHGYYFCWTFDEETLSYFHRYDEGFIARKPLKDLDKEPPLLLS